MKRTEWLIKLEQELTRLGVVGAPEVVADYEEHFSIGASQGLNEEQIAGKLGDPSTVAKAHQAEALITKTAATSDTKGVLPKSNPDIDSVLHATFRVLLLTPLNFVMLICPFLILSVFLLTGWMTTIGFAAASVVLVFVAALALPFLFIQFWSAGAVLFGSLAFISLTIVALMTMFYITQALIAMFVSYLRWNVNFVLEKK